MKTAIGVAAASLMLVAAAGLGACSDDSPCTTNLDCAAGQVCSVLTGLCSTDPNQTVQPDAGGLADVTLDCEPAAAGELILHEILADPGGADVDGDGVADSKKDEFIELVNISGKRIGTANVNVQVTTSSTKTFALGAACLEPWQPRVLFGSEASLGLTNSGGTVSLMISGVVVESHTYGAEADKDESITRTVQLDPSSGWSRHSEVSSAAFSPGKCANGNDFPDCAGGGTADVPDGVDAGVQDVPAMCSAPAPVIGAVLINEILADPGTTNDANGDGEVGNDDEFVEIVNVSGATVSLAGVTLTEGSGKTFTFPDSACLAAGQAAVMFARHEGTAAATTCGALLFSFDGAFGLNNSDETVTLSAASGDVLDAVAYGSEGGKDQSIVRATDADGAAAFVLHSESALGGGATMSPGCCQRGTAFPDCGEAPSPDALGETLAADAVVDVPAIDIGPPCGPSPAGAGQLVINEVLADPASTDVNGDGVYEATADEFIELVNLSGQTLSLAGVEVLTGNPATSVVHTFGQGECLDAGQALVLFGPGSPTLTPEGALVMASQASLSLNNGGDAVAVRLGADALDAYTYTALSGQSWTRDPAGTGSFVKHTEATGAVGGWSPGTCVDGAVLTSCLQ